MYIQTLAEMYLMGHCTRKVKEITEQLGGVEISAEQVRRSSALLDAVLQEWWERSLGEIQYLYLDTRNKTVRESGRIQIAAVLVITGINPQGERQVLGVDVSLSEHETHGRPFLQSLRDRVLLLELVLTTRSSRKICWVTKAGEELRAGFGRGLSACHPVLSGLLCS